jgi:uncharacterized repeat protein (TIGR01451 family)
MLSSHEPAHRRQLLARWLVVFLVSGALLGAVTGPPLWVFELAAMSAAEPCLRGTAIWADNQTDKKSLDWSGSQNRISGNIHSNSDIHLKGSDNVIAGMVRYGSTFTDTGRNNQYERVSRVAPSARPVTYSITDYQPGGAAARAAMNAGKYHLVNGKLEVKTSGAVLDGLYYVTGNVELKGNDLSGRFTIVAEGKIEVKGSAQQFTPYLDGLLLFANTSKGKDGIEIVGQNSVLRGILYGPGGLLKLSGSSNSFHGSLLGDTVEIKGSDLTITFTETYCSGSTVPPLPTATPAPSNTLIPPSTHPPTSTPTATFTQTPTPTFTPTNTQTAPPAETAMPIASSTETATATPTPIPTETAMPTATATAEPVDTATPLATDTPEPTETAEAPAAPTPVPASHLQVTKVDYLWLDADANEEVSAGDTLFYEIKIVNDSPARVTDLRIQDIPDAATTLRSGTVKTDRGAVVTGNSGGDTQVVVEIGTLEGGEAVKLGLQVLIRSDSAVQQVENQAEVTFRMPASGRDELFFTLSDDPDTPAVLDATVTPLKIYTFVIYLPVIGT